MDTVKRGIQSRYPLPCEKLFAARVLDIIDAAVQSGRTRFTAFLDLNQRRIAAELAKALNVPVRYWGGYEDAERAVAAFSPVNDCEDAGRFRLIEIGPPTRKGRLALSAVKYR